MTQAQAASPTRPMLRIRRATVADIPEILQLEVLCFPSPWPAAMFQRELQPAEDRLYIVAETKGRLAGYGGMWFYAGEAHVSTLAVAAPWRRSGIGEILMLTLLNQAARRGGRFAALEYRILNEPAARLYRKLGFSLTRLRKGYYTDTGEDAVEVMINDLATPSRQQALADLTRRWMHTRNYELSIDL